VGKTTSAVNLGAALAAQGKRVLLIDLDPQAHLTLHLGIEGDEVERTLYDLLIDPECAAEEAVIREARQNLDVILSEVDLAGAETELASTPGRQSILRQKLQANGFLDRYEVVLIDCPPSLGLLTLNALALAAEVFVPMQAHFLALQGVGKLLETVGLVCGEVNPALQVTGIVLCMHEGQTTLAKEIVADLDSFFEGQREMDVPWRACRVLRPAIRRNIKLAEAPSFGKTIFDYSPWCPGALDYRKLAENLIAEWDGSHEEEERPEQVVEVKPEPEEMVVEESVPVIETMKVDGVLDHPHSEQSAADAKPSIALSEEEKASLTANPVTHD